MSSFPTPGVSKGRPISLAANVVGTKPAVAGIEILEHGGPFGLRCTEFKFTNCNMTLVDNGATGSGSVQLYDLPNCLYKHEMTHVDLAMTCPGFTDAGLVAAVGAQAAGADGTLTANEVLFAPSTAAAMSAGVGTAKVKSATANVFVIDGTSSATDLFFNLATANDPVGNKTITLNGSILFFWINGGDS